MKNQKSFRSFQALTAALLALPAVTALIPADPAAKKVATEALTKGVEASFNRWYEARAAAQFGIHEGNGYPGDVAAFQLALKAGFFAYRYAFPAGALNMALESIQANLPPVAEIDGYSDNSGPSYVARQILNVQTLKQKVAAGGLASICDCPACRPERQLVPDTEADQVPASQEPANQQVGTSSDDNFARHIAAEIERLMRGDSQPAPKLQSYRELRQELVQLGAELRSAFEKNEENYVRRFTSMSPSPATLRATIVRLSEIGFTDVTEKWIRIILESDPTFVLVPKPGTREYLAFLEELSMYYPDRAGLLEYPQDQKATSGFRLRVLEESLAEGKRLLATEGPGSTAFKKVVKVMASDRKAFLVILAKMAQLGERLLMETFLAGYEELTNDTSLRAALSPSSPEYEETQRELAANFG